MHSNQDVPPECTHSSICDRERGDGGSVCEDSDFCPQATDTNPSSSFPQFPQKEYLGSGDKSHQGAFSGLLRAGTTKSRSPLHFQSDHILQFPICVLKNIMVTSSASIHIDQRHSHDKDSLAGHWPLRQATKKVTSSLRDVPGVRALPHSQTCSCNFQLLARLGTSIHIV